MKNILKTSTIAAAALTIPAMANAQSYPQGYDTEYRTPHQECKRGEDKRQILGGVLGAVAGGVIGSQVSGNGARTEGSAIGAVVGGLAGVGIADKTIDCDPVYPTSSYRKRRLSIARPSVIRLSPECRLSNPESISGPISRPSHSLEPPGLF